MKRVFKFLLVIAVVFGIGYLIKVKVIDPKAEAERIEEIKKGWYLEVKKDGRPIREEASPSAKILEKANKGAIYKCVDAVKDSSYVWYKIELKKGKYAFMADTKGNKNLDSINGTVDLYSPILKFYDDIYRVESIDSINYDHLEIWDDKPDYIVEHEVYHELKPEEDIDQYWIRYTVTDAVGNKVSKTQKIEFNKRPAESKVKSWLEYPNHTY